MQTQRNGVIEATEQAQGTIAETAQTVKDAASNLGGKAQEYAGKAQEFASEAGRQANAAAQTAYGAAQSAYTTGNEVLDMVEGFARENVWGSLLIAGVVGYGLACLMRNSR